MGFPRRVCIHAWRFRRPSLRSIVFSVVLGTLLFTGMVATPSAANTTWTVDRGQWEAADSLGFSPVARMQYLIAPQAVRRVLPPLSNEFITLIKDTSLAAVIGFDELFRQGQLMVATTYRAFAIYCAVALVYLIFTTSASLLFKRLERRLSLPG